MHGLSECPLARVPREEAAAFVERLYSPGERFERAFYYYWREVLGLDELEARLRTRRELESAAHAVIERLDDSHYHVLISGDGKPIGLYGFRPIEQHPAGRTLASTIEARGLRSRYPAPLAFAHAVAVLDGHSSLSVLKSIFVSIGCAALEGGYERVLFFTSDHRLRALYRRFGMEFPDDLAFPDSRHLVGFYNPSDSANLRRLDEVRTGTGR